MRKLHPIHRIYAALLLLAALETPSLISTPQAQAQAGEPVMPAVPLIRASGEPEFNANPTLLLAHAGKVYYLADDGVHGQEPWVSDGTAEGTRLLADMRPGPLGVTSVNLIGVGASVYLSASWSDFETNNATIQQLWHSDGTPEGTALLYPIEANQLVGLGSLLYFQNSQGLWRSDGTAQGLTLLRAFSALYNPPRPVVLGNRFFFGADGGSGMELWASDGTLQGTLPVKEIGSGIAGSAPELLTVAGPRLFFFASDGRTGRELWLSDGSARGTRLVKDSLPGLAGFQPKEMVSAGSLVYFSALVGENIQIWRSDGSARGTRALATFPATWQTAVGELTTLGTSVFFKLAFYAGNSQLWRADATAPAASLLHDFGPSYLESLERLGNAIVFGTATFSEATLWRSDGTPQSLTALRTFRPYVPRIILAPQPSARFGALAAGDQLYFSGDDGVHGFELWTSDGSAAGTRLVKDVEGTPTRSYPSGLTALGQRLLFSFYQANSGHEPWASSGTGEGTTLLKDINPGPASSRPSSLTRVDGRVYFLADDGTHGNELWASDGTAQGTALVKDFTSGSRGSNIRLLGSGTKLYAVVTLGSELQIWGSTAGGEPSLVRSFPADQVGYTFVCAGGLLFFYLNQPEGTRVWASDGSAAGTQALVYGRVDAAVDAPAGAYLTIFAASTGSELWKSDGRPQGTTLIKDINPGPGDSQISRMLFDGNTLYFGADDGVNGFELWKSDGTEQGTSLVKDIIPGSGSGLDRYSSSEMASYGGRLFFATSEDYRLNALWVSDGTTDGTRLVKAIPYEIDRNSWILPRPIRRLVATTSGVAFIASDTVSGYELWFSDGSTEGTARVQDLAPEQASGLAYIQIYYTGRITYGLWMYNELAAVGDDLYFFGDDRSGRALFKVTGGSDPYVGLDVTSTPPGGTVELPVHYGNLRLGAAPLTVTLTIGDGLSYLGDTTGVTPTLISNTISWFFPRVSCGERVFGMRLQVPAAAPLGKRYTVEASVQTESDADPTNNRTDNGILVARQTFMSVVER